MYINLNLLFSIIRCAHGYLWPELVCSHESICALINFNWLDNECDAFAGIVACIFVDTWYIIPKFNSIWIAVAGKARIGFNSVSIIIGNEKSSIA